MSFDKRAYWEGVLGDGTRPPATDFVGRPRPPIPAAPRKAASSRPHWMKS
jgi:hypothetical protein